MQTKKRLLHVFSWINLDEILYIKIMLVFFHVNKYEVMLFRCELMAVEINTTISK